MKNIFFVDRWRASCENIFWSIDGESLVRSSWEFLVWNTWEYWIYIGYWGKKGYLSQISEGRWRKEGWNWREDKFFWWCFLRYVIYRSSHHFRYNFFFYKDSDPEIDMQVRKHNQVFVVKKSACGSFYFWSYTLWKIGFVASPETSQNQVFRVKMS